MCLRCYTYAMQRVLGIGVVLGVLAAFVSWLGGDEEEFCDLARGDGLVVGRHQTPGERKEVRERLDEAAEVAPGRLSHEVDALREAADARRGRRATPGLADDRARIDAWVDENCG